MAIYSFGCFPFQLVACHKQQIQRYGIKRAVKEYFILKMFTVCILHNAIKYKKSNTRYFSCNLLLFYLNKQGNHMLLAIFHIVTFGFDA